jgi:putative phosphoribosyl transferase
MRFRDRFDAGRRLAERLRDEYGGRDDVVVLALPRGGVPVGYELARVLGAPLDVFLVRKLGVPGHEELALGAIAGGGVRVLNDDVVTAVGLSEDELAPLALAEQKELERREQQYRNGREPIELENRIAILVDDGLATGASMRAAAHAVRQHHPKKVVIAVPVAGQRTCDELRSEVDEVVCATTPEPFLAVGYWYEDFTQTTDDEVRDYSHERRPGAQDDERRVLVCGHGRSSTLIARRSSIAS